MNMIGISTDFDFLYDPQQRRPVGKCPMCGAEIWRMGKNLCTRCSRSEEEDE